VVQPKKTWKIKKGEINYKADITFDPTNPLVIEAKD
jgi:hypothetical protein